MLRERGIASAAGTRPSGADTSAHRCSRRRRSRRSNAHAAGRAVAPAVATAAQPHNVAAIVAWWMRW